MDTKEILLELRIRQGLSQEQLAEKVYVTRQAVSRWEVCLYRYGVAAGLSGRAYVQ
ncbi:MAG: helix-turn-helix transcriptional regulator [Eubacteriales bacterium]